MTGSARLTVEDAHALLPSRSNVYQQEPTRSMTNKLANLSTEH